MAEKTGRFHKVDGKLWKDSLAKQMLILDLKNGKIKPGDSKQQIYESKEEYLKWPAQCFRNNLGNLFKAYQDGKSPFGVKDTNTAFGGATSPPPAAAKSTAGKPKPGVHFKDDLDDATKGMASFGFYSKMPGDDDDDDKTVGTVARSIPPEINVKSLGGNQVKFPMLQFGWEDEYGRNRVTAIIHLPSGSYRKDFLRYKVLGDEQKVVLFFDWTSFRVLDPDAYGVAFNSAAGHPLYQPGDTKIVAYRRKIRQLKGKTWEQPVKSVMEIDLPFPTTNKVTDAEGYPGFQILKMGESHGKPQIFCHIELMGVSHGHYTPAFTDEEDFLDSSSSEEN